MIIIERPLLPCPPLDASPEWCLMDMLIFHGPKGEKVWEQKIPEAGLYWMKIEGRDADEFANYFHNFEVYKDGRFGWQLRFQISHERANFWYDRMMAHLEEYHKEHFKKLGIEVSPDAVNIDSKSHSGSASTGGGSEP